MTIDPKTIDPKQAHLWIVGGGIAGMATAAFAIRDAGFLARTFTSSKSSRSRGGRWTARSRPSSPTLW